MAINFRARQLAQLHTPAKRELRSDVLSRRPAWKSIPEREAVRLPAYIHTPLHPIFRDNLARRHSSRHDSHAQFQRLIHHYTHLSGELLVLYAPPASACLPHTSAQTKILQAANCRFFTWPDPTSHGLAIMTKPKKDIKFQHRERRTSRGSNSDSPTEERMSASGMSSSANGFSKSPTRNGDVLKQNRADAAAGWATDDDKPPVKELSESEKKKQTFITRTIWTIVMIAFFFGSMFSGHIYMLIIVTAVQIISYKEVIAIANVPSRARSLRFTKTLNWYFLGSTMYFLYGESVIYYFKHIVLVDKVLLPFATHHRFISFMLYVMGMYRRYLMANCPA